MAKKKMKRYAIGIDGGSNTGLAVWDRVDQVYNHLQSHDFWAVYKYITGHFSPEECTVYIEDPSKNKPVFTKRYDPKSVRAAMKIAQDVGGVKRETELIIQGLENKGYEVKRIRPQSKKWDAKTFKKFTGYQGRTNEHTRDAGRLVFGR